MTQIDINCRVEISLTMKPAVLLFFDLAEFLNSQTLSKTKKRAVLSFHPVPFTKERSPVILSPGEVLVLAGASFLLRGI